MIRHVVIVTLALLAAGCDGEVSFCIQYVNGTDLNVTFQAIDSKNVRLEGGDVAMGPPDPEIGPIASPLTGLKGTPPITFSAPFQINGDCKITPTGGHTYIILLTSSGEFQCYDDQTGRCEAIAARPKFLDSLPGF